MEQSSPSVAEINKKIWRIKCEIRAKMMAMAEPRIWKAWQAYYLENLYTPSAEPHETAVSMAIQVAISPEDAVRRITAYHEKYPSSVGADAGEVFRKMYYRTRDAVVRAKGIIPISGWIQVARPRRTGV